MAFMDRLREAWELHKEDRDMDRRLADERQHRPGDNEARVLGHLDRVSQPAIDKYLAENNLREVYRASPAQVDEMAVKVQQATGMHETNARMAVLQRWAVGGEDGSNGPRVLQLADEFADLRDRFYGVEPRRAPDIGREENYQNATTVRTQQLQGENMPGPMYAAQLPTSVIREDIRQAYRGLAESPEALGPPEMDIRAAHWERNGEISAMSARNYAERLTESVYYHPERTPQEHISALQPTAEDRRRWEPLIESVGVIRANDYRWINETGDVQTYQNWGTEKDLHVAKTGQFYDRNDNPISREEALENVRLSTSKAPTQNSQGQSDNAEAHRRAWEPLEKAIGNQGADQYRHYGERENIQIYGRVIEGQKVTLGIDDKGQFYDLGQREKPAPVSREQALEATRYVPMERMAAPRDTLERVMGTEEAKSFTWKQISEHIHSYEHADTGKHLHLDSKGQFYSQDRQPITKEIAIQNVLNPVSVLERSQNTEASSREAARPQTIEQSMSM